VSPGRLYGIGVGPGDPELITLRGLRLLQAVPVVAFPAGRHGQPGFAERIVAHFLRPEQRRLPLDFPFVSERAVLERAWRLAADRLATELGTGRDVAFLTEGDASFYSTFTYLLAEFQGRYPEIAVTVVPGVASPMAAAAALQRPLVIGDEALVVLPTMHRLAELDLAAADGRTVVLLKVAPVWPQVHAWLSERSLLDRAFLVAWVSTDQEKIYSPPPPPESPLPYFCLLVIVATGQARP